MINFFNYRSGFEPNIFHAISRGGIPPTGRIPASPAKSVLHYFPLQGMVNFPIQNSQPAHSALMQFQEHLQTFEPPQMSNY